MVDATRHESVPVGPLAWSNPLVSRRPQPRRTLAISSVVVGVIVAVLLGVVTLPYYSIAPGQTLAVNPLINVEGNGLVTVTEGRVYPPTGELLLTTVSLRRLNGYGVIEGWLRGDVDVFHRDKLFPPSVEDPTAFNRGLMNDSQIVAKLVALRYLGYDVHEDGAGALVLAVEPGFPADRALHPNDVIVAVDGTTVRTAADAVRFLGRKRPGQRVTLRVRSAPAAAAVVSSASFRDVTVVLGERADGTAVLGVQLQTARPVFDFPLDVVIDAGPIGGPSAGLAFTLATIDELTPGELTGGNRVAVTGTIRSDRSVGDVGGVAQKTVAVRRSGAVLFLVPSAELATAQAFAGDLRVEPVDTLEDALAVLATLGGNADQVKGFAAAAAAS